MTTLDFSSLGISAPVCQALAEIGYQQATPIQAQAIPELLAGKDLLGVAQTGTGKTAAFSLPIIDALLNDNVTARPRCPKVLILAPTRELAAQIRDEIASFARHTDLRYTCIYGGVGQNPQVKTLAKGVEILVATPGRLLDLAQQRKVDLGEISHLVLDEADRLMDMGFIRDVKRIVKLLPRKRQSLLFSATMPDQVASLAADILHKPVRIDIAPKKVTVELIDQGVLRVGNDRKQAALQQLLHEPGVTRAIVFTRTKHAANRVAKKLDKVGIMSEAIHGNKSQNARTRALDSFKSGDVWVLVATDIAARGIDIDGISHVINFELPHEPESYVHRIGRTARAGASGVAWSLVDPSEVSRLKAIERLTKVKLAPLDIELAHVEPEDDNTDEPRRQSQGRRGGQGRARQGEGRQGDGRQGEGNQQEGSSSPTRKRRRNSRRRRSSSGQQAA